MCLWTVLFSNKANHTFGHSICCLKNQRTIDAVLNNDAENNLSPVSCDALWCISSANIKAWSAHEKQNQIQLNYNWISSWAAMKRGQSGPIGQGSVCATKKCMCACVCVFAFGNQRKGIAMRLCVWLCVCVRARLCASRIPERQMSEVIGCQGAKFSSNHSASLTATQH